jgi:hypothetical protein
MGAGPSQQKASRLTTMAAEIDCEDVNVNGGRQTKTSSNPRGRGDVVEDENASRSKMA